MAMEGTISGPSRGGWFAFWRLRRIVPLSFLLILCISAAWWAPVLADRLHAVSWRNQCLTYVPPQGQVVYEEDPTAVEALQNQPGYELTEGSRLRWIPDCWRHEMPGTLQSQGTVFLHERTSPAGHQRLVAVDVSVEPGSRLMTTGDIEDISFEQTILVPGHGFDSDKPILQGQTILWICPADPKPMRFFGGFADPNDASKFQFDYERAGRTAPSTEN